MVDFSPVNNNLLCCPKLKRFPGLKLLRKTTLAIRLGRTTYNTLTYCLYERRTGESLNYDIYCKMKGKFSSCRSFAKNKYHALKIFRLISLHRVAPEHLNDVMEDLLAY